MKKNRNNNKFKEFYLKLKEEWKDPRKKAGIKLLGYLVFFLIFAFMVRIASGMEDSVKIEKQKEEATINETLESFREKQQSLLNNSHSIKYEIKIGELVYNINGTLKDNIIEGYLEGTDSIKKIIIKENNLYDITNGIETLLDLGLDMTKLDIKNLVNIMENNNAYIDNKSENLKNYQYAISLEDIVNNINVYTNDKKIEKIVISDLSSEYILVFDS